MKLFKFCPTTIISTLALGVSVSHGAIAYSTSGSLYSQNFDGLSATTDTSNPGPIWTNDSTLTGWSLFQYTNTAITDYFVGDGGTNGGHFFSYGAINASDRALGGLASGNAYFGSPTPATGAVAGYIAVAITNTTASTLDSFTVGFDGEEWRDGGANGGTPASQAMVLEYGYGSSFASVTTWIAPGSTFDWTSPVFTNTTSGAAVVGNVAGLVFGRGGSVTGQTWAAGSTLWVRWIERNDSGNDHGLAIDNFTFTAAPEPSGLAFAGMASMAILRRRNR